MRTLAVSVLIVAVLMACEEESPAVSSSRRVTVLFDRSDTHLLQTVNEDIVHLLAAYGLDDDPWRAVDLRVAVLGAVAYNRAQELHLPAEDPEEGNILLRKRRVKDFAQQADGLLRHWTENPEETSTSVVYLPLVLELERLARHASDERELIIYSDLVENHGKGAWSLYDDALLDSLKHRPALFVEFFGRQRPLPDLHGITITLVNIPRNTANSERVSVLFSFYERLLEDHGASVEIGGNYIHHRP